MPEPHRWAPFKRYSRHVDDDLRDEVAAIEGALRDHGELDRIELRGIVDAGWRPGLFGRALGKALQAGLIRRTGRNRFALAEVDNRVSFVHRGE
ncbi:MAG: hypothetical protein ACJ77Z_11210 [Thermoleophilaceae bacterium]